MEQTLTTASAGKPGARPPAAETPGTQRDVPGLQLLAGALDGLSTKALMHKLLLEIFPGRIALVSSFGAEAAVLLDLAARVDPSVPVVFLDTGKHFLETLTYRDMLVDRLRLTDVRNIRPVEAQVAKEDPHGELWRDLPDGCCDLRKVRPLDAALAGFDAWFTGRKRYQGGDRQSLPVVEQDGPRVKINPLAGWSAPGHRGLLHEFRPAASSAVRQGIQIRRLRRLHLPSGGRGRCALRPLAREWQDRMRNSPRQMGCRIMSGLDDLEEQSVYIFREAFATIRPLGMLWSLGKDSNVMLWLARKAFCGHVPFRRCMWTPAGNSRKCMNSGDLFQGLGS